MFSRNAFAEALGVSPATVMNWEYRGLVKPVKTTITGRVFYSQEQLDASLAEDYSNPVLKGVIPNE